MVISENPEKIDAWIKDTISQYKVSNFDVTYVEKNVEEKNTIGIEQIRLIQKSISLRPLQGQIKAVVIKKAELLTIEAQNALLKTLEEPPQDTIIILAAKQKDMLISTIVSRCRIIDLGSETPVLSPDETAKYQSLIRSMQEWGVGERLKQAEILAKDKQEAILYLEKMILATRTELIVDLSSSSEEPLATSREVLLQSQDKNCSRLTSFARTIRNQYLLIIAFQRSHKTLSTTNVNPRLALETMFLSLSSSSPSSTKVST
ncbi:MAG: hypothetical protein HYT11_00195 [Candidatus Levybacteria bacterium]|nr:hypothetical protein [Candidatus Levybacteria bacterium]